MDATLPFRYVLTDELTILAVDDDPIQREFCTVYLSTPQVEVETAENAEDGLRRLAERSFDVALIDVEMPGMDGIEMLRRIRANPALHRMPVMVITGREDMEAIDAAFEAGATSFMCKPVNWRLLSHQIRFLVRAHRCLMEECPL